MYNKGKYLKPKKNRKLTYLKGQKTHVLTVRVNPDVVKKARHMGINMSAIMSDALERYVTKEWGN